MLALRYQQGRLSVSEVPAPAAGGEAVVRVTLSGVCNTDLEIARGYAGFEGTIGHEFVGVVESAPGAPHLVGRRVVGEINAGCGACELCAAGDPRHCPRRTVLGIVGRDGAHAEFLTLPAVNLLALPNSIPDERAVFCEPLAAACGITERVSVREGERVAVVGDGKLGLLCAQALRVLTGAEVTLVGRHESKMEIARRRGVETLKASGLPGAAARAFDVAVEASGSPEGFRTALSLLRPRGTLVLKSTFHGKTELEAAPVVVDEMSIVGSRCGRFAPALELLAANAVDVEGLIHEEFPLAEGVRAVQRAAEPGVLKVLIRP
ncbi:MAG TPA: alcohol dehydrogenase catalytic domain-containing protein [Pyrinomonadaceae bacterium]|nr:alcohol dehydrogenase catalytic domain-containing protein [Pyrinomonadaceae bacterium]